MSASGIAPIKGGNLPHNAVGYTNPWPDALAYWIGA